MKMRNSRILLLVVGISLLGLSGCASTGSLETVRHEPTVGSDSPLFDQLRNNAAFARKDVTIAVGECSDKTGQFKDTEQLRYSRVVTQACQDYLKHILREAGFTVVDRSPYNLELLSNEHRMANTYKRNGSGETENVGLIQRNRPVGGIVGANLVWSAAISSYASSVSTAGGGTEVLGTGINYQESDARVSVITHLTGMDSVIIDSQKTKSVVEGRRKGVTLNRIATVWGNETFFSAELGKALQVPVDLAFEDALIANVVSILGSNKRMFYKENAKVVSFNMQKAATSLSRQEHQK